MNAVLSATRIDRMRADDSAAVRAFLAARADATVFQTPEWQAVIRDAYGHACDYWVAWSGTDVAGVFPVSVVRAPLLGVKMVALGYQMDGALPLSDSPDISQLLLERAAQEAKRTGARYLELRSLRDAPEVESLGLRQVESGLVTTVVPLAGMTLARVRRNHRRCLRTAQDEGVTVVETRSRDDLRRFQRMYLREGRAIGAPQAGRRFFDSLHRHAHANYRLYEAWRGGRPIAGMVTVGDASTVYARHAAYSGAEALQVHAGTALYWRAIEDATDAGCSRYNCGISWMGDSGLIHWKEGWNAQTMPVRLYVLALRGDPPVPGEYVGGYGFAKAVWRRLPLPLADLGGQLVTRWVC